MPQTKNQIQRLRILDKYLSDHSHQYTIDQLTQIVSAELLNNVTPHASPKSAISRKTITRDLQYLENEYHAPIEKYQRTDPADHSRIPGVCYRYSDPHYSCIMMLSQTEIDTLMEAAESFKHFAGIPYLSLLSDSIHNLMRSDDQGGIILAFEENALHQGLNRDNDDVWRNFNTIYQAASHRQVLKIHYQPHNAQPEMFYFHPAYIKQHNCRWYAFGYSSRFGDPSSPHCLPIDHRILNIEPSDDTFHTLDIDWEDYFSTFIGVSNCNIVSSRTDPYPEIRFRVFGNTAQYIISRPFHSSQRHKILHPQPDSPLYSKGPFYEFTLTDVKINHELIQLFMKYADSIQVITPDDLRDEVRRRLQQALQNC